MAIGVSRIFSPLKRFPETPEMDTVAASVAFADTAVADASASAAVALRKKGMLGAA